MESEPQSTSDTLRIRLPGGSLPLGYARSGARLFLVARERGAQWPVEILRAGRAEVLLPDGTREGPAELVTEEPARKEILSLFRSKYGAEQFARWYDHPARIVRVTLDGGARAPGSSRDQYYGWLQAEFDNIAAEYDHHILGNRMNMLLRDRSLALLRARFAGRARLLEIGCGSGMETLPLLRAGHSIVAIDISERMLEVVRGKAEREGLAGQLETRRMRASDARLLLDEFGESGFDAAYSTYGALNCEPDLAPIAAALRRLLAPRAPFVAGVYNRWCLFEIAGYAATLQTHRALGRRLNPVLVGSSRFCVDIYAYSVTDLERVFAEGFTVERTEGVPVLLPPSDLVSYAEKFSRHFDALASWDAWLGRRWPWNRLGDHFLTTFIRAG